MLPQGDIMLPQGNIDSDPNVTYSDPKVTLHTSPYLYLPHQAHITPLVKSNETSGEWWWWKGGDQL